MFFKKGRSKPNCLSLGTAAPEGRLCVLPAVSAEDRVHSNRQPQKTQVAENMPGPTFKAARGRNIQRLVGEIAHLNMAYMCLHHVYIMMYSSSCG